MTKKYKHDGTVWARVIQVIQEAMLMGVDCVDLLRQIEVVESDSQPGTLTLSVEYVALVEKMHQIWLENALKLQEQQPTKEDENVFTFKLNGEFN